MGQRSQIYVRMDGLHGKILIARYYGWVYGTRLVSRATSAIKRVREYLNGNHGGLLRGYTELIRILDTSLDMSDVQISTDLIKEWHEGFPHWEFANYLSRHSNNNDVKLFLDIDIQNKTVKYAFADRECHVDNIMDVISYMDWDYHGTDWRKQLPTEVVAKMALYAEYISANAGFMTAEDLAEFIAADYNSQKETVQDSVLWHYADLAACQIAERPYPFKCPRCGKHPLTFIPVAQHKIFKRFPLYVCDICNTLEADGTVPATENPLTDWYAARVFRQSQEVPFSPGALVARDFELTEDGGGVECTFECWFDTEKKFGYRSFGDDGTWVNLYATFYPAKGALEMCYTISRDSGDTNRPYFPTAEEREMVVLTMEKGCYAENGCSMTDFRVRTLLSIAQEGGLWKN